MKSESSSQLILCKNISCLESKNLNVLSADNKSSLCSIFLNETIDDETNLSESAVVLHDPITLLTIL